MNYKLLLLSAILLPFSCGLALVVSGITISSKTLAQQGSEYTGTFTNTTLTESGTTTMSVSYKQPDSISGYINFTQQMGQSPLCGAGYYQGHIVGDSIFLSFSSSDTDNSCGFDYGWLFEIKARFYSERDSIAGVYFISNPNREQGIFNLKRPSIKAAVSTVDQQQVLIYPNPVSRKLVVDMPQGQSAATAVITDQSGRRLLTRALTNPKTEISLDLPDGIYFISIGSNGLSTTKQFLVRH